MQWQQVLEQFFGEAEPWYLDRPRGRLQGRMWGRGRPIYFLPGMTGSLDLFALLAYLLKEDFRCLLLDYPGTRSSCPPTVAAECPQSLAARSDAQRARTLDDYVDDLFAIADVCGDTRFSLYATGFGGLVAMRAMQLQPTRIDKAVLQATAAVREFSRWERWGIRLGRHVPGCLKHLPGRHAVQQANHRPFFPLMDPSRWDFFAANTGETSLRALAERALVAAQTDLRPLLPDIRQPVLLLQTEGQGTIPGDGQHRLAHDLPQVRVETLHTTGDLTYLTHPHRLAKLLREFLPG